MKFSRCSGILLHPTSLPGPFGSGDLGAASYHFVDWLVSAGQSVWQMLPIGPVGVCNSPYLSLSAFAGNPLLIDLQELSSKGWLTSGELENLPHFPSNRIDYKQVASFRMEILRKAAGRFFIQKDKESYNKFEEFCNKEKSWLDDYAIFRVLDSKYKNEEWASWDQKLDNRTSSTMNKIMQEYSQEIQFHKFTQWCFHYQWKSLKEYANARGIKLFGDIPIFVSYHSVDVWTNPYEYFLDDEGRPTVVAGVPPDYFSKTGQRWGNPIYRWEKMKTNNYKWWVERFRKSLELFDIIRLDHFRGFESYWEIPSNEENAIRGKWVKGPGLHFFKTIEKQLSDLPIIAEDLGLITPKVHELRNKLGFPGMKVLQFAFAEGSDNPYLPHNYEKNSVVYTGTHDNDTTCGWYSKASEHERRHLKEYCQTDDSEVNWALIRLALQSVADIAIIPFQDVLGLGSEARMNLPGTDEGNWEWRFTWEQVGPEPAKKLRDLSVMFGRYHLDH